MTESYFFKVEKDFMVTKIDKIKQESVFFLLKSRIHKNSLKFEQFYWDTFAK